MAVSYRKKVHKFPEPESNEEIARQYKKFQGSPKFDLNSEEVYCICRKPDVDGALMVGCDGCDEWYHFKCVGLDELYKNLIAKYFCKFCTWQGKGVSQFKRKCRLDTCWNSVDGGSKYCSKECGLRFFESLKDSTGKEQIKHIINTTTSLDEMKSLGSQFPELPEVMDYENNMDKFPEDVKAKLTHIGNRQAQVNQKIVEYQSKTSLLAKYKEFVKRVNEEATRSSSKKKVELCLHSRQLLEITDEFVTQANAALEQIVAGFTANEDYVNEICVHEKRKCPRHNGWMNLINDGFLRTMNKLNVELLELDERRSKVLRDYSVSVYES